MFHALRPPSTTHRLACASDAATGGARPTPAPAGRPVYSHVPSPGPFSSSGAACPPPSDHRMPAAGRGRLVPRPAGRSSGAWLAPAARCYKQVAPPELTRGLDGVPGVGGVGMKRCWLVPFHALRPPSTTHRLACASDAAVGGARPTPAPAGRPVYSQLLSPSPFSSSGAACPPERPSHASGQPWSPSPPATRSLLRSLAHAGSTVL